MIYHAYKGMRLSFIGEKTSYMHLNYVDNFVFHFTLDLKTTDLLGKSPEQISDSIDTAYAKALTVTNASSIRLKAESIQKNCICQFDGRTIVREDDLIKCSLKIKIYEYNRTRLISDLEWNNSKINELKINLNELNPISIFKKRDITKKINSFEKRNDYLLEKEISNYKQWFAREFVTFKLSILLLEELMQYVVIFAKKDIVKTLVLLDTIVEKFYSFKLSAGKLEIGSLQLLIDSSVEEFTKYVQNKIEELRSFDVQMVHGEMFDDLDEERKKELNDFKKIFFNE